jgi:nucleoid-associated protein YgaU
MPVKPDSRFAGLPVLERQGPDGILRKVVALRLRVPRGGPTAGRLVVQGGELIDLIARRIYGTENMWWRILDANKLVYPLDLGPGDALDLPGPGPATRIVRARSF